MSFKPTSVPTKRLSASITSTQTSFKLDDIVGWNGVNLTAADFGTQAYGVFRNGRRDLIEIFEFDPATIASASITIVRRGLSFTGDRTTEISGNKLEWTAGDTFVDLGTDTPQLWQYLEDYINDVAISGAPNAGETVKGIVEEATDAQTAAGDATGETGAKLFVTPAKLNTRLAAAVLAPDIQIFTAGGTWTKPAGAKLVEVFLIGGGGGGGGASADSASTFGTGGAGGAGGGYSYQKFRPETLTATVAVTVGAGGTAGVGAVAANNNGGAGGAGGATSFGAYLIATGATGGGGGVVNGGAPAASVAGVGNKFAGSLASVNVTDERPAGGGQGGSGNAGSGSTGGARITTAVLAAGAGAGGANPGPGGVGGNGNTFDVDEPVGGTGGGGGGGGASNNNSVAVGGNGGLYGGGGGGGGSAFSQGANGGVGGAGVAMIVTYF